jgi:4-amino-4-deoxy-L-arabinose transferase-like glycosyltransferase
MNDWERRSDEWLSRHERLAAGVLLLCGFLARVWVAHGTFLNPDEALHFQIANQTSWALAYRASLTTAHPPLLIFLLHFLRALGTSEFLLRLPSVIAGTVFCWLLFRWTTLVFGRAPGWMALMFASFLPPLIALSSEVRQYALLLAFMSAAMWLLEQAFAEESAGEMLLAYGFVLLALLTHYSAFLFATALGAYSFFRWMERRYPAGIKIAWGAGQVSVLAMGDFLYRTHLSALHSGASITSQDWLYNSLYHRGQQNLVLFVFARTFGVFQFVFGQLAVGDVAGVLFVIGVVYLVRSSEGLNAFASRGSRAEATSSSRTRIATWILAVLLTLPFLLTCAAAIVGVYPYGGTRHSAFLIPFAIAGVTLGLTWALKQNMMRGLTVVLAIVAASAVFGSPHRPYMTRQDQSLANMSLAMTYLQQNVPPEDVILTDYQTSLLLGHYLCQQQPVTFDHSIPGFLVFHCGGHRILSTGPQVSIFTAESFLHGESWSVMPKLDMKPGDRFWIVQAGWDIDLARQLHAASPRFRDLKVESFGRNIQLFPMVLEPEGPVAQ